MTQTDKILRFMQDYGTITAIDAYAEFGCMRLAARISDLKRGGHKITRTMRSGVNRYGEPTSYAEYRLED